MPSGLEFFLHKKAIYNKHPHQVDKSLENKANLRDLIAATGLVILLKLDSNHWFFILYDLEIKMDNLEKQ